MQVTKPTASQLDIFTGWPVVIQGDHAYIHEAKGFVMPGVSALIAANAVWSLSIKTPIRESGKFVHLRPTGISSTANTLELRIAEGSVITGGTAAVPLNRNRNSKKVTACQCLTNVTIATEGTVLDFFQVGSGAKTNTASGGGGDGSTEEWVLKPDTVYSFRFHNIGTGEATLAYYNLFWYEEDAGAI